MALRRTLQSLGTGVVLSAQLGISPLLAAMLAPLVAPMSALAIPEADAFKKLAVIPVFVLTNDKGIPIPIPRDKTLILPMYLDRAKADAELANFRKANPGITAQILPMPWNVANERMTELSKQVKEGFTLVAPVVPLQRDVEQATAILKKEGLTDKQIEEGLSVPVFFTQPFLTLNTPEGQRGVFFLNYDDFQKALSGVQDRSKLKIQAADVSAVLQEIIKAPKDNFIFYPTPDYFKLVEAEQRRGSAPAGPASPNRP